MRIVTAITLARPIEQVFNFVTTPANWPRWHPASLSVSAGADHSLQLGEQVTEQFRAAGISGSAVWTVREHQAPVLWRIEGLAPNGSSATITYRLAAEGQGTRFERELVFGALEPRLPDQDMAEVLRLFDLESSEGLRRLKAVLEGPSHEGPASVP